MRKILTALAVTFVAVGTATAGTWETSCIGCHNGTMAPSKNQLRAKFKDKEEFVKAALKSTNPMMTTVKGNKELIKKAADEVFGK